MATTGKTTQQLSLPPFTLSFDAAAFDAAIRDHGVKLIHWRAMRCPVGMTDQYDIRRPHEDHSGCSNGFIYTRAGSVTALFTANGNKADQNEVGILDGSTVQVTVPRRYDDVDDEVMVAPFDRFYLDEENVTVPHQQLVEAHITGKDKLDFPAVRVLDAIDASGKRYGADDFALDRGQIVWTNGGLGFDGEAQRGTIYSIRYTYRPYWYVDRVLHQVRVAQIQTVLGRKVVRMPQQLVLQREYVAEKEEKDSRAPNPDSPRQAKEARTTVFGPR